MTGRQDHCCRDLEEDRRDNPTSDSLRPERASSAKSSGNDLRLLQNDMQKLLRDYEIYMFDSGLTVRSARKHEDADMLCSTRND